MEAREEDQLSAHEDGEEGEGLCKTAAEEAGHEDNISTREDLDVKISDRPQTPERENTCPTQEEEDLQLLQELCEDREAAGRLSSQLQRKLVEFFRKKEDSQLQREVVVSELEYEENMKFLLDLKQQLAADSQSAEQQAEELRLQAHRRLDQVESEWRAFVALKEDVAVKLLSRPLGKQAAQAKVESTLAAEQLRQDELIKLRLKHIKLRISIHRLEAELRDGEEHTRDPLKIQFEQLQTQRLELKKHSEKLHEESLKMQKKISSSLELLSNVKEKLFWSQMEVQAKREQLAEVEATVTSKRHLLTRTKQAHSGLQRDNLRLTESRGLLGNRILLQDFEDTVDRSKYLEGQLENLKAEIAVADGRRSRRQVQQRAIRN